MSGQTTADRFGGRTTGLTARQEALLARYRELWADLNTVQGLIEHLQERVREIKAEQRRLANLIAAPAARDEKEESDGS